MQLHTSRLTAIASRLGISPEEGVMYAAGDSLAYRTGLNWFASSLLLFVLGANAPSTESQTQAGGAT